MGMQEFYEQHKDDHKACWLWTGPLNNGTPWTTKVIHAGISARRKVYVESGFEEIQIPEGHIVVYTADCKNKLCVNPHHASLSTRPSRKSNWIDRVMKTYDEAVRSR